MERQNLLMLVLDEAGESGLSPVQVQKTLFLLGEKLGEEIGEQYYKFEPYDYGPFCPDIYSDLESLEENNYLHIIPVKGRRWDKYVISSHGEKKAEDILEDCDSSKITDYLPKIVKWIKGQTFKSLLRAIYQEYPEMATNSVFH